MAHKRHLQDAYADNNDVEEKRQRTNFQSVVLEALGANAMQRISVVLEPMLRRVVSEEVERVIAKYFPSTKLGSRMPSKQPQGLDSTSLRLQFQNKLALPLYTGSRVEGEHGNSIRVSLQDAATGEAVIMDDEPLMKLEIVVLEGDFSNDEEEEWTYEDFESHVVKEREGKRPLLTGDRTLSLKDGVGTLGELVFTDNSSWIRSRKFRLGVRLLSGAYKGVRVREARTEAFLVKDQRGQLYKKHYPPALTDEVWRLEKIGKDGAYHKRLCEYHINTVKDFLVMYSIGPSKLREIFGTTMSTRIWESIIEHANTCTLNDTRYVYYPDDSHTTGVLLNTIYRPLGIVRKETLTPVRCLSESDQVYMKKLVHEAYKDVNSLCELPTSAHHDEPDGLNGSGYPPLIHYGLSDTQISEKQEFQVQRSASNLPENNVVTLFPTGYMPNMTQNSSTASALGTGLKSFFTNTSSSGTLESIFLRRNHLQKEVEPMGADTGFCEPNVMQSDDYNDGRAFDELMILSGLSSRPLSNTVVSEDGRYSFSGMGTAHSPVFHVNHLHRRACMGWLKLKAVFYFMKKGIASRRRPQIKQLN